MESVKKFVNRVLEVMKAIWCRIWAVRNRIKAHINRWEKYIGWPGMVCAFLCAGTVVVISFREGMWAAINYGGVPLELQAKLYPLKFTDGIIQLVMLGIAATAILEQMRLLRQIND